MSRLVIMGSGETAPTMVRVHRQIFADSGIGKDSAGGTTAAAVVLDTTFGFQNNAPDLVDKTIAYFVDTVGQPVAVARWRHRDEPAIDREKTLAQLQQSRWAFAGPGSPTYALRQWLDTPIPTALADLARRGGTVVMGSAAAVTLGSHAIPVYEIYKAGEDPHWLPGIDLLGALTGLRAAVIPHYNNNEGGSYDTHFCYLGEQRLALMETQLPAETGVLGVDEHTALIFDLTARTATVAGNGLVTVRNAGVSQTFESGTVIGFAELDALLRGTKPVLSGPGAKPIASSVATDAPPILSDATPSLAGSADAAETSFQSALAERDVDGCVAAILGLDETIHAWAADTLQSDDANYARRVLRSLIVQLGGVAELGARDPRAAVEPFVDALLAVRATARAAKDFATSDLVRDRLAAAGVEVRDTADGVDWVLTSS